MSLFSYEREARREERAQQSMKLHGIVDVRLKKEREKKLREDQEWAAMVNAAIKIFEPSAEKETVDNAEDDSDNAQLVPVLRYTSILWRD